MQERTTRNGGRMKDVKQYLITDQRGSIMAWSESDEQICYCTHDLPARFYTKNIAQSHIKKAKKNRLKWGFEAGEYRIQRIIVEAEK